MDEEGRVTSFEYDRQNRLITENRFLDGRPIPTRYTYDPANNQTGILDALGRTTETRFDQWSRPHQVIDPGQYVITTERDSGGNEVKRIDGNGHARTWIRDKRGLVVAAEDAEKAETHYSYDLNGNTTTVDKPNGAKTLTTYDAEDHPRAITEAAGTPQARTR
ncbi:MAG: hypothetical protein GY859_24900, partial [Desulfobacterales bacterium]|nr:hypothetical protein [Desulfobacterales bacterium]